MISLDPTMLPSFASLLGVITAGAFFIINSRRRLSLQRAETYLRLELESSRLFEVARQNPEMMWYLSGKTPEAEAEKARLSHELEWYIPQVLNLFEIALTFRRRNVFENDVFVTWVSWFLELSSSERFPEYWQGLRFHYKPDLRDILEAGIEAKSRFRASNDVQTLAVQEWFFGEVSKILRDPTIPQYFSACLKGAYKSLPSYSAARAAG